MKTAVIGVGNMGSRYAGMLQEGMIRGLELAAVTRLHEKQKELLAPSLNKGLPVYESADTLFEAVEEGSLALDAVIIAVPHPLHSSVAVRAFQNGLHVLCDKPAGVCTSQAKDMEKAADESGCVFGMIFNQRVLPQYQFLHNLVQSGKYGALKRVNWVVTDWYRPDSYYAAGSWRATWKGEGGGVLLNQCPHNLDLLQWICGMPVSIQAFCHEGKYHPIETEDDAALYMEWENGASGTFITSTGDAPGINRLEISLEEAMLVCENGEVRIGELYPELGCKEAEYRKTAVNPFRHIIGTWTTMKFDKPENPYRTVLQAFADAIRGSGTCVADGREGRKSLMICNAAYVSSWKEKKVTLPAPGSNAECLFEAEFETLLNEKIQAAEAGK